MKRLALITCLFITPIAANAKVITLNIPDDEIKIVENDVIDAEQWIKDAWRGKVNACKGRLVKEEVDRSVQAKESIPAGDDAIIQKVFSNPKYKNRKEREKDEEKERDERFKAAAKEQK